MSLFSFMLLQWLETEFLGYLKQWEESVSKRQGFSKKQKATMMLSLETITGLRMTGDIIEFTIIVLHYYYYFISAHSFLGLVQHVFSVPGVKENKIALLSRNLCQDPLENFFGCQRQRGGTSDNPNASEFQSNTQAL